MSSFEGNNEKNRRERLDSFWTLDNIVPKPKKTYTSAGKNTDAVEISFGKNQAEGSEEKIPQNGETPEDSVIKRFIPPFSSDEIKSYEGECDEYVPESMLIKSIKVYNWKSNYNYYAQFAADAERLYRYKGNEAEHEKFFSYVPQYSQLTREQLLWYLWWRTNARKNIFLETDYSYILLYIFEILNLPDVMDKAFSLRQLASLWCEYRETYPQLDRFLGDWICDYAVINHLSSDLLPEIPSDALKTVNFKEFFISGVKSNDAFVEALLAFSTNYDYRKSKFAVGENRELYDKHVRGVLGVFCRDYFSTGTLALGTAFEVSKIKRDSFVGAVSCYKIKKKLEIEFLSFSHSHELRYVVTDVIKYSENKLRAYLGVKSRLGVCALSAEQRELIDSYFAKHLPSARKVQAKEIPVYEKLYDLPSTELSAERAREIEENSWSTTKILVEAFEEENTASLQISEEIKEQPCDSKPPDPKPEVQRDENQIFASDEASSLWAALGELYGFIELALIENFAEQKRFASEHGIMPDALADRINEVSLDIIGDILLLECGDGYAVVDDYKEYFE